ncbi:MAG: hypothetical protein V3U35_01215 [Candidatus Neomarinimicrobiota bacterium]
MNDFYHILRFLHVMSFVFMSIPLFNLIVVNERAQIATVFDYYADRYFENVIRRGALRCFVFQGTALVTGLLLLAEGPLGIAALWGNGILLTKTLLLVTLTALLSYVHFGLQPRIEALLAMVNPDSPVPDDFASQLKPFRVRRKRVATLCLFLVITTIILGLQVYSRFSAPLTLFLIGLAGLFAWRVNRTLLRFGWL